MKYYIIGAVCLGIVSAVGFGYRHYDNLIDRAANAETRSAVLHQSLEITSEEIRRQDVEIKDYHGSVKFMAEITSSLVDENSRIMSDRARIEQAIGGLNRENINRWRKTISLDDINRSINTNINGLFDALSASSKGEVSNLADYMPATGKPPSGGETAPRSGID